MLTTIAQAKGGVGKTTSAINIGVLLAGQGRRVLLVDTDPQAALTRQLGIEPDSSPTLVDVLAGTADSASAVRRSVHGVDVLPWLACPRRCRDEPRRGDGPSAIPTGRSRRHDRELRRAPDRHPPPNLGLLTVNALVCAACVIAPVSAEDEGAIHGIAELRKTPIPEEMTAA